MRRREARRSGAAGTPLTPVNAGMGGTVLRGRRRNGHAALAFAAVNPSTKEAVMKGAAHTGQEPRAIEQGAGR
jgi:hypothetical protein